MVNKNFIAMRFSSILLISIATYLLVLSGCQTPTTPRSGVNAILGDDSFVQTFGALPDENDSEIIRIRTHLSYVENLLRQKPVDHLSESLQEARLQMLNMLRTYTDKGAFPTNYDFPDRRIPCFIDRYGNICAVGYLVSQTAGVGVAEAINREYQYDLLMDMNNKVVDDWIAQSGLTKEECAMIQPSYFGYPYPDQNRVSDAYAISSASLTGVNLSLNLINSIQMASKEQKKVIPYIGLATGAGQVALGVGIYPRRGPFGNYVNGTEQTVSMINIGVGAATLALSSWNLISNKKPKNKDLSWNVYSFQTPDNQSGMGLSFTKRF